MMPPEMTVSLGRFVSSFELPFRHAVEAKPGRKTPQGFGFS
jgi:hypothetical protein